MNGSRHILVLVDDDHAVRQHQPLVLELGWADCRLERHVGVGARGALGQERSRLRLPHDLGVGRDVHVDGPAGHELDPAVETNASSNTAIDITIEGEDFDDFPPHQSLFHKAEPIYEQLGAPYWREFAEPSYAARWNGLMLRGGDEVWLCIRRGERMVKATMLTPARFVPLVQGEVSQSNE